MKRDIMIGVATALATAAAISAATPAHASPEPLERWTEKVSGQLSDKIIYPADRRHGIAVVTFQRGEDGRAQAIQVVSGRPAMARAARQTLMRLRNLPPMPTGFEGARIKLQMLAGVAGQEARFRADETRLIAAARTTNAQLAQKYAPVQLAAAGGQ